jgi:hypothetical protein
MVERERTRSKEGSLDLTSKVITLEDGDVVSIWGPFHIKGLSYTHIYQNNDTRELDERFELEGDSLSQGDKRLDYRCDIVNSNVQDALSYWVRMAQGVNGNFVGFREDEIKEEIEKTKAIYINLEEALRFSHNGSRPYLRRKMIEGHSVLFPRNLPIKK